MNLEGTERIGQMKEAMAAFERTLSDRVVSAMPAMVQYVARIGRVVLTRDGEDHVFHITREKVFEDGNKGEQWTDEPLDVYRVRDGFFRVATPSEALDFLSATGEFSPLSRTIRWSEFKLWQRFARLVQEHNELASAMQSGRWTGELGEVLKALTGLYPSRFFDLHRKPQSDSEKSGRSDPKVGKQISEGEALQAKRRREIYTWFREPQGEACSIHWIPKEGEFNDALLHKLQTGGAMIEYLLPREKLRPVFLIQVGFTLHAIAAAIYTDRIQGVEYRTCSVCNALFKVGAHKEKKYCNREQCKNTAHQRNRRAVLREREGGSTQKRKARKGGRG